MSRVAMREFERLILASASRSRSDMLSAAGLSFDVLPASVDEDGVRQNFEEEKRSDFDALATALAEAKAQCVSQLHPEALVIGADQILVSDGSVFSKADSREDAKQILSGLRGKTHELISAVVLTCGSDVLFRHTDRAELQMRAFSDAFLDDYLSGAGRALYDCVGCYELEGLGIQLFERVQGSYFTILGMPLLPLLDELRRLEVILK